MNLLIENNFNYHFEILESIIVKYQEIINQKISFEKIYLQIYPNSSFESYIKSKYSNLEIKNYYHKENIDFDYKIIATIYPEEFFKINDPSDNIFYICHQKIEDELIPENLTKQILFLSNFSKKLRHFQADILPFKKLIKFQNPSIPIFIVQGNFNHDKHYRRNLEILDKILIENYQENFLIKLLGRGEVPFHLLNHPKIKYLENLDFQDFHYEFLNAFAIITCISKKTHPQYYSTKLTSSINYGLAYNLHFLIDEDLFKIYYPKKSFVYQSFSDIPKKFNDLLNLFYQK
jgi:hypothetical protein